MYSQIFRKKNKKKYEEAKYYPYIIFMLLYREEEKKKKQTKNITELQNIWETKLKLLFKVILRIDVVNYEIVGDFLLKFVAVL